MTIKRDRGRPPGTKDPDDKAIQLWLAVELERHGPQPCSVNDGAKRVAHTLRERGHDIHHKHVDKNHRQIEKRRATNSALALKLDGLLEFAKQLPPGGVFVPNAFRTEYYESAYQVLQGSWLAPDDGSLVRLFNKVVGKFLRRDDPLARRIRRERDEARAGSFPKKSRYPFRK